MTGSKGFGKTTMEPPWEALLEIAAQMEQGVACVLPQGPALNIGHYEWETECCLLLISQIRHVEALIALIRSDVRLLPAAFTLARTILETGVRIQWLLAPADPFARESRFLAMLSEDAVLRKRLANTAGRVELSTHYEATAQLTDEFVASVRALLPRNTKLVHNVPSMRDMLKQLGKDHLYPSYLWLSQVCHGTHAGGGLYRQHLGTDKAFQEPSPASWAPTVQDSWIAFVESAKTILQTLDVPSAVTTLSSFGDIDTMVRASLDRLSGGKAESHRCA